MSMRSEDWITLPEVVMNVIEVELNEQARALYDEMDQEFMVELEGQTVEAKTGGDKFGKLLQLCNGFLYRKGKAIKVHDCKLEALKELVETSQGNILIAYYYEHDKDLILKTFKQAKALGKDPALIDEWNRGEVPIMLVHPQSAGHGLNIQFGGSVIIWYGVTADLEAYQQLNARLHRFGQQSDKVIINHILAKGTKDEYVYYELLASKAQTQSDVLDALDHRHKISDPSFQM